MTERPEPDRTLRAGALSLDLEARQADVDDRPLELTAMEFDLLAHLVARPGSVFSRDELLRAVWHSTAEWQQAATVTEHIRRLRTKIETDPQRPQILRTVRGAGYRLDLPAEHRDAPDAEVAFAPGTVIHVDGRIVRADAAAGVMFDLDEESEMVGRQVCELMSPASRRTTRTRLTASGPDSAGHTLLLDLGRDGTEIPVEVATQTIDWNGACAQRVSLTHAPDTSAYLRRLVTDVLSELTDAVIITDLHGHVQSWNHGAERLYGWEQHDVLGRHVLDVIQWTGDDGALAAIWDDLERSGTSRADVRQVTQDGSVVSVRASITLVRDDAGIPVLIVSVNRPTPDADQPNRGDGS